MWSLSRLLSHRGNSTRSLLNFVVAGLLATFFAITLFSSTANAADATWRSGSIYYDAGSGAQQYAKSNDATTGDTRGLTAGSHIYAYLETTTSGSTTTGSKAHLIIFEPSVDPLHATSAKYQIFSFVPPDTYSNPSTAVDIVLEESGAESVTSCAVGGLGWIICPVMQGLAEGMDTVFDFISSFMEVQPIMVNDNTNTLFVAWDYMRSFANIAFVIAFLIIIYSQVTGMGIKNYGIKSMLPRIVVAVVLVNLSYYICALAVDVSNVLGFSIQDMLKGIFDQIAGTNGNTWSTMSWSSITGALLTGGTIIGAAGIGLAAAGSIMGVVYLALPILLGFFLAIVISFIVLAARQAIITILIIIAPLAFVAYILPNTEKWFDKWRGLFMTMLIFFPAFSLVFGGSQLASSVIIRNADSFNGVLIGMAVSVTPLFVTPLLMKFSGGILSKLSGVINDKNKGVLDRSRNWAKEKADIERQKALGRTPSRRRPVDRMANAMERGNRKRASALKKYTNLADARYNDNVMVKDNLEERKSEDIKTASENRQHIRYNAHKVSDTAAREVEFDLRKSQDLKTTSEQHLEAQYNHLKSVDAAAQQIDFELRQAKQQVELTAKVADVNWDNLKAGDISKLVVPNEVAINSLRAALKTAEDINIATHQQKMAVNMQQDKYAEKISNDEALRTAAGGVAGEKGADKALASAVKTMRSSYSEAVSEATEVMKHYGLSAEEMFNLVKGGTATGRDESGHERTFTKENIFMREAVIEEMMAIGTVKQVGEIIELSGSTDPDTGLYEYRKTISAALAKNGAGGKSVYLGGKIIDDVKGGKIGSPQALDASILTYIESGKFSAQKLAEIDAHATTRISAVVEKANLALRTLADTGDSSAFDALDLGADITPSKLQLAIDKLATNAATALSNKDLEIQLTEATRPNIQEIAKLAPTPPSTGTS